MSAEAPAVRRRECRPHIETFSRLLAERTIVAARGAVLEEQRHLA